jgi:acetoin utilization deacetylase AcuC-like enzyme
MAGTNNFMHGLRRFWRRLVPPRKHARIPFVSSDLYTPDLALPPFDTKRPLRILGFLESEKLIRRGDLLRPRRASLRQLRRVHPDAYLDSLEDPGAMTTLLGFELSSRQQDDFLITLRAMVGGTLLATKLARDRSGVAVNLGGGFHHALAEQGQGYCAFNDVAVAIAGRREHGFTDPILVVDLDLHDGEGTRSIFATDPTVHTYSIHNQHLGPTAVTASTSIALGDNVEDEVYLQALRESLPDVIWQVRPRLVYYLAGTDPALDDDLGNWRISAEGMLARDRFVIEQIHSFDAQCNLVILLAGGYGKGAWHYSARFFAWLLGGARVKDPPLTLELPLNKYRRIFRRLEDPQLTAEAGADGEVRTDADNRTQTKTERGTRQTADWSLSEQDLFGASPAGQARFLDYYSLHGFEMALEKYGLFDRLRSKGYRRLKVEWELDNPLGHTFRIISRDPPSPPLIELRLRRDRTTIPGMEMLVVEWLQIQDAKAPFNLERKLLPGQKYPGMGLLRDMGALMVLICERLGLDGLLFTPSHYYLALLGHRLVQFLNPADEARFRALQRITKNLHLDEAARAVDCGRIVDRNTSEPYRWEPAAAVLPVSPRLREWLNDPRYWQQVAEYAEQISYGLSDEVSAED